MTIAATFPAATSDARVAPRARHPRSTRSAGVRLTRRGRIVLGVAVSLPFAALMIINGSGAADAGTQGTVEPATAVVVVQSGESLWQIAQTVAPSADPRSTITAIRELNALGTDTVVPGQSLVVPAA